MSVKPVIAAGGIVWRVSKRGIQVLLAHRPKYDDWSFPKGKLDPGETTRQAAAREVEEETGFVCKIGPHLGLSSYETPAGLEKEVHYWAMRPIAGRFIPNDEVDKISWTAPARAAKRLSYERDRVFLSDLARRWWYAEPAVFLVRHARAGNRKAWQGDDALRPLSKRGIRQANWVAAHLVDSAVVRIVSSPALRCRETAAPLSDVWGVPIETHEALSETASPEAASDLIGSLTGTRAVVFSHAGVIQGVLKRLEDESGLVPSADVQKGSIWEIRFDGSGAVTAAEYTPPPEDL